MERRRRADPASRQGQKIVPRKRVALSPKSPYMGNTAGAAPPEKKKDSFSAAPPSDRGSVEAEVMQMLSPRDAASALRASKATSQAGGSLPTKIGFDELGGIPGLPPVYSVKKVAMMHENDAYGPWANKKSSAELGLVRRKPAALITGVSYAASELVAFHVFRPLLERFKIATMSAKLATGELTAECMNRLAGSGHASHALSLEAQHMPALAEFAIDLVEALLTLTERHHLRCITAAAFCHQNDEQTAQCNRNDPAQPAWLRGIRPRKLHVGGHSCPNARLYT